MAATNDDGQNFIRTVTPLSDEHPNQEMDVIGWLIFLVLLVVLLPLLPVILIIWVVMKLAGR